MNKELKIIGVFYGFIVLIFWIIGLKYSIIKQEKLMNQERLNHKQEILDVKKVVIEMDNEIKVYLEIIESLNEYADEYDSYRNNIEQKEQLLKDLIRNTKR